MNPFTSTTLNYDLVQDRRRTFEDAAARRRLLRFSVDRIARRDAERPPDPVRAPVPVLALVESDAAQVPASQIAASQHLPAAAVSEPATARVA